MIRKNDLIQLLHKNKVAFIELAHSPSASILITPALGGRILGVFIRDKNLLWGNEDLASDWNCGGHRTWFAPEWQDKSIYLKPDRQTWFVDRRMDPGNYRLLRHKPNTLVEMASDLDITSIDGTAYSLTFTRKVQLLGPDELSHSYPFLVHHGALQSLAISFEHRLKNRGQRTIQKEIGLWSILQVNPPGTILVPLDRPTGKLFYEYYDPFPASRWRVFDGGVAIFVDGARRYKLGFPPDHTFGKIGYLSRLNEDEYGLIVKSFASDPHGHYVDKPRGDLRWSGDAIQIYNHSEGGRMAFAELECHAPAEELVQGGEQAFRVEMWFGAGGKREIAEVASELLFSGSARGFLTSYEAWDGSA